MELIFQISSETRENNSFFFSLRIEHIRMRVDK